MVKEFQKYELDDFLNDSDFCAWVRFERSDLDGVYKKFLKKYPEQEAIFYKAQKVVELFDDEKLTTDKARKEKIWEEINTTYHKQKRKAELKVYIRVAAAIVMLITISSLALYFVPDKNNAELFVSENIEDYTETKLILNNEEEVNIESDHSEIIYDKSGGEIKVNDNLVKKNQQGNKLEINQLIVPYGKQSKIVLSDGTKVWLNAGSQLSYPSSFAGSIREVHLKGEAFFDVKSDVKHPFYVVTTDIKIQVTGTRFNVSSYADDENTQTVLVSGRIEARENKRFSRPVELNPGERVVYNKANAELTKDQTNVELYSSWINGYLIFEDETVDEIFKKLERFYNKKILVEGAPENTFFTGKLNLAENLESVIRNISFSVPLSVDTRPEVIIIKIKS